jgi:membrane protein YdbS with pleckstrin-like domain
MSDGGDDPDAGGDDPDGGVPSGFDEPNGGQETAGPPDAGAPPATGGRTEPPEQRAIERTDGEQSTASHDGPADREPTTGDGPADREPTTGDGPVDRESTTGDGPVDREPTAPAEYTTGRRSLSPTVQLQWGIRMVVGVLVLGAFITLGIDSLGFDPLFGAAVIGVLLILGSLWVALHYRIWVYQIRGDAIYLERGVLTHVRTLVPYVRIQHVDTSRGPFERALGLSTLVVYTAGSRGADVSIPGLTPTEASDLQQRVKELAIEAEGDDAL